MKKRILIFSIAYEPLIGGAELAVRHITDRLFDFEFDLITCRFSRRHKAREKIGNVNVYRVGFGSRAGRYLYPVFAWRLARKLHQEKPYQIVWSIMAAYAAAAALMFLRRYPLVNYLLTLQEGDPIVHIHRQVRGFKKMWQRIFGRADYVTAISQYLADWARQEGATCPIEIIPNGVAVEKFEIRNSKSETNSKAQIFKIITTSRLVHKNGIDILIKSISNLKSIISNLKLQILGSGPDEKKLKALMKKLGLEDNIEFLGDVEPEQIPKYLAQADIFARPSRSEGLGISFLEAMAARLPVIGTRVGGIPDFLTPYVRDLSPNLSPSPGERSFLPRRWGGIKGEVEDIKANGLFVKVDDPHDLARKIKQLMDNPDLRIRLGQNGRQLVEQKYNWDKIADQMDKIFRNLTPDPSPNSERAG